MNRRRWGNFQVVGACRCPRRGFRTTVVLVAVFVLSLFDLAFTQTQIQRGNFAEVNVVAAAFANSTTGIATYKTLFFGIGAVILYRCRSHRASEVGVWLLLVAHAGLMVWWVFYLDAVEVCAGDPAITVSTIPY